MKSNGGIVWSILTVAAMVLAAGSVAPASMIPGTTLTPGLWFEADVGVTLNGSNVSTLADQSGGG